MGVQISRGVHSQVPQEDGVRGVATASGRSVPKVGRAEGEQNRGGPSLSRSRAHVDLDPAKNARERLAIEFLRPQRIARRRHSFKFRKAWSASAAIIEKRETMQAPPDLAA